MVLNVQPFMCALAQLTEFNDLRVIGNSAFDSFAGL